MKLDSVSILIPLFNHEKYIEECLSSIQKIKFRPLEVVITDDHSSDNSFEIARKYLEQNFATIGIKWSLIKHKKRKGPGATANSCLRRAKGNHILAIASDDYFLPENVDFILDRCKGKEISWLVANGIYHTPDRQLRSVHDVQVFQRISKGGKYLLQQLYSNIGFIFIQASLIDRNLLSEVGGWDENMVMSEDWSLTIKLVELLSKKRLNLQSIDRPIFYYRQHHENSHKDDRLQYQRIINCIDKYIPYRYGNTLKNRVLLDRIIHLSNENKDLKQRLEQFEKNQIYITIGKVKNLVHSLKKIMHFMKRNI